mgnify:CR=1 FL=1
MKPLYCFKYDEETGKIETIVCERNTKSKMEIQR